MDERKNVGKKEELEVEVKSQRNIKNSNYHEIKMRLWLFVMKRSKKPKRENKRQKQAKTQQNITNLITKNKVSLFDNYIFEFRHNRHDLQWNVNVFLIRSIFICWSDLSVPSRKLRAQQDNIWEINRYRNNCVCKTHNIRNC